MIEICNLMRPAALASIATLVALPATVPAAETKLADQPIRATIAAPANVLLTPSVEFPTAISQAHLDATYNSAIRYDGYFDPNKCYNYVSSDPDLPSAGYFQPVGFVSSGYACAGNWSGNFMNWATMQGIDLFRWALTGGYRSVEKPATFSDTASGRTVLTRAWGSNQGSASSNFKDRTVAAATLATSAGSPLNTGTDAKFFNWNRGSQVRITQGSASHTLDVRIEVCVDEVVGGKSLLESNCKLYRDPNSLRYVYRPEGLMQENANTMRFGVFGYLVDNDGGNGNLRRGGGVLRGRMTELGAEISDTGAFVPNPAPSDAASSLVSNSGVINYLNKFGSEAPNLYKRFDPVSELYAEALRYLKGYSEPTAGYADGVTVAMKENFPVITQWDDPIIYACQKNFILGIGDTNSHADRNLAGGYTGGVEPSAFPANLDVNWDGSTVKGWTDTVGVLEGYDNLGSYSRGGNNTGVYMAGAAYWAHTHDIRPGSGPNEIGRQTVSTFWVDVLEGQTMRTDRNQYLMAAKYGGFEDVNKNGQFDVGTDVWNAKGRTFSGTALPDNYFPASQGSDMVEGLRSAFKQIKNLVASGAGVGLASSSISTSITESSVYGVSYDSDGWAGSVKGFKITDIDSSSGVLTLDKKWDAASKIDDQDWNSGRRIATSKWTLDVSGNLIFDKGIRFRWAEFSAAERSAYFNNQQSMLQFLRGRRDAETTDNAYNLYRQRKSVLGDVVNSEAVYVGEPSADYSDAYNPGYANFKSNSADRTEMIYVGANDGMLHAIFADTSGSPTSKGGKEAWAYIPSFLLLGPDGDASKSGLWALSNNDFVHHNYVDATPVVRDVDFTLTSGSTVATPTAANSDWRTVLVGGLGKGGRGYYAIDITDPSDMTTEEEVAEKVLWEFTDEDMGFSYGRPLITKTRKWGWVVMLTSGYNNIEYTPQDDQPDNRGKGILYILDIKTGELLQKIVTTEGSAANPAGFAQVTGYTLDYSDYTTEQVYGGDLLGNVWRFDVSSATNEVPAPVKLAVLEDADGNIQPVTTAPQIEYGAGDPQLRRWVFVGTGQQLDATDSPNSASQTFYAIRDGSRSKMYQSGDLPTGVSFPLGRAEMKELTYAGLENGGIEVAAGEMGWYVDLTGRDDLQDADSASERVVINPVANDGIISWVGSIPSSDPCTPTGTARVYAVKYATGASVLYQKETDGSKTTLAFIKSDTGLVKAQPVRHGNSIRILGTDPTGDPSLVGPGVGEPADPRVVNWRFIN